MAAKKPRVASKRPSKLPGSIDERTLEVLAGQDEDTFMHRVVVPLLRAMDAVSSIDVTHGMNEAGRDLVWVTKDQFLDQPKVVCVQVKSHRVSTGSMAGPYSLATILNQVQTAKMSGVVMPDGSKVYPDAVWVINSHRLEEPRRRNAQDVLAEVKARGGTFIDGTDVCRLMMKHCPELLAELSRLAAPELVRAIASLSAHHESRAFGLRIDRALEDFHVSARACPTTGAISELLDGALKFERMGVAVGWTASGQEADSLERRGAGIDGIGIERSPVVAKLAPFVTEFDVPAGFTTRVDREAAIATTRTYRVVAKDAELRARVLQCLGNQDKFSVRHVGYVYDLKHEEPRGIGIVDADAERSELVEALCDLPRQVLDKAIAWTVRQYQLGSSNDRCLVSRTYVLDFAGAARRTIKALREAFTSVPKNLSDAPAAVGEVVQRVKTTERFIETCEREGAVLHVEARRRFRGPEISVPDELQLLKVGNRLLVEGPPGSGKTTLLRRLAINLLSAGRPTLLIPCSSLRAAHQSLSLEQIARRVAPEGTPKNWKLSESVLLVDGLDESPFDLSKLLLATNGNEPKHIVASTRLAYETALRSQFLRLEVVPFSEKDRDSFFAKWFQRDPERLAKATRLIGKHADIAHHTRIPLVATVLAALVEKDFAPTTRNAVYNDRLELLLTKWDYTRGVQRKHHVDPELTRRFLEHLAFYVHARAERRSTFELEDFRHVFVESLGKQGESTSVEELLHDLVVNAGVLVRQREMLSFGHLTFQEHLVGCYLRRNVSATQIVRYLGHDWWREPLLFYAGEKGAITDVVRECEKRIGTTATHGQLLLDMIRAAPYTHGVAEKMVRSAMRAAALDQEDGLEAVSDAERADRDDDDDPRL